MHYIYNFKQLNYLFNLNISKLLKQFSLTIYYTLVAMLIKQKLSIVQVSLPALTCPYQTMEQSYTVIWTLQDQLPCTPVIHNTLSMERLSGSVRVMNSGVAMIQLVKVLLDIIIIKDLYTNNIFLCTVSIYLSLGPTNFTTNNTEILITTVGEGDDDLPRLTCHTDSPTCCRNMADNNDNGALGQWTYPNGSVVLNNMGQQDFYIKRDAPQSIHLNRKEARIPMSPVGSYCCTVPTTRGNMTLCANLGE